MLHSFSSTIILLSTEAQDQITKEERVIIKVYDPQKGSGHMTKSLTSLVVNPMGAFPSSCNTWPTHHFFQHGTLSSLLPSVHALLSLLPLCHGHSGSSFCSSSSWCNATSKVPTLRPLPSSPPHSSWRAFNYHLRTDDTSAFIFSPTAPLILSPMCSS